jgi:hypothetical protein
MAEPAHDRVAGILAPAEVRVVPGVHARPRTAEFAWIQAHADEYPGEWIVLDGDRLLAHGLRLKQVREMLSPEDVARDPLFHRVDVG